jgi:hypothetical protein
LLRILTVNMAKAANNNYATAWSLDSLKLLHLISQSPLPSASHKVLAHEQNVDKFFATMQHEQRPHFRLKSYEPKLHSLHSCQHSGLLRSHQNHPLSILGFL